jgi:hypothetical protein
MKKFIYLFLFIVFACDKEDVSDCFQTEGELITQEFTVTEFQKILVNRDVELIISQGENYRVIVETGSNLLNDIFYFSKTSILFLISGRSINMYF